MGAALGSQGLAGVDAGFGVPLAGLGQRRLARLALPPGAGFLLLPGPLAGEPVLLGPVPRGAFPVRADPRCLLLPRPLLRGTAGRGLTWRPATSPGLAAWFRMTAGRRGRPDASRPVLARP